METQEPKRRGRPPKIMPEHPIEHVGDLVDTMAYEEPEEEEMLPPQPNGTKVWASVSRTLNMGNYESLKIDLGITGIPVGADDEYIEQQLNDAEATLKTVVDHLANELGRRVHDDLGR